MTANARKDFQEPAGCNSATLPTVPWAEVELLLKSFSSLINFFERFTDKVPVPFGRLSSLVFGVLIYSISWRPRGREPYIYQSLMACSVSFTAFSTSQVPAWSLGEQLETSGSCKSFSRSWTLMLSSWLVKGMENLQSKTQTRHGMIKMQPLLAKVDTFSPILTARRISYISKDHWILGIRRCCMIHSFWVPLK